ncbi:MAG: ATP-binding cassette domain-containing protein [Caulobacteraceae bacterium]
MSRRPQPRRTEPPERPVQRNRSLKPLVQLRPFVRAHWTDAALAGIFLLLSTTATFGVTFAARSLADAGLSSHLVGAVGREFIILGLVVLGLALATAGRFYFINKLGERVVADLRTAVYARVVMLDQAWLAATKTGEVLSRMTTDLTIVENMVGSSIAVALRNLLIVVVGLSMLIVINPGFTGFVALLALLTIAPLISVGRRVRRLSAVAQWKFAEALGYAGETLEALDTIQAFGREASAARRFKAAVETAFDASLSRVRARAAMTLLVMVLVAGGVGLVLWRASVAAFVDHTMSPGALLQFVIVAILTAGAVGSLGETWGDVQKTSGAMERIGEMLAANPAITAPARPRPMPKPPIGDLALERVTFAYPGRSDQPALNGFDLKVRPGERIALVGPSGAGKSTVFRLLLRFYDPQSGVVKIDGIDVSKADPAEVRGRIALVAQDAPLFSGSAMDNLRLADEEADEASLLSAAKAAQVDSFISALPKGYDTPLGERGRSLSGGERQRLAIARALAKNAPILLLDEATSALDSENEDLVQKALASAMGGRTTLVIAHRLATVMSADRIVVMDRGKVVECGIHTELSVRGGLYSRLASLQFGAQAA